MNIKTIPLLFLSIVSVTAQATLYDRGEGLIYDDVLNITWLQDANYANTSNYSTAQGRDVTATNGKMTWNEAIEWSRQLNYKGYNDWHLPEVKPINGSNFQINVSFDGSSDFGERITSTQSELSYMYFVNLNNTSAHNTLGDLIGCGPLDSCLINTVPFDNLIAYNYWSDTQVESNPNFAWSFNSQHGIQTLFDGKGNYFHAWAVHSGDISAVPIPSAFLLLSSAIISLTRFNKKK